MADSLLPKNDLGTVRKYMAARGLDASGQPDARADDSGGFAGQLRASARGAGTPPAATQPGQNQAGARAGPVSFLDNTVQVGTGTVKLRATLPNKDHYFWPGQFVMSGSCWR
jgi:multidrug efflux pump subunit AcrA (membrane-fusion protein)